MIATIIILNYESPSDSINLAKAVSKFQCVNHVLIVDNGSNDNSVRLINDEIKAMPKTTLLCTNKNLGFAAGNDFGLAFAKKEFEQDIYVVSNPDTEYKEELLLKAWEIFKSDPKCGECTFDFCSHEGDKISRVGGSRPKNYWEDYFHMVYKKRSKQPQDNKEVDICFNGVGGLMIFEANRFEEINFFDPSTFLYGEELIVGERFFKKGYHVCACHSYSYSHRISTSASKAFSVNERMNFWFQSKLYYWKHYRSVSKLGVFNIKILRLFVTVSKKIIGTLVTLKHKFNTKNDK